MEKTPKKSPNRKTKGFKPFSEKLPGINNLKILALLQNETLTRFDKIVGGYLGSHKRRVRPCIYWKTKEEGQDYYKIVFLTSSRFSPISIDLSLCPNIKKNCSWFQFAPRSFVIFSPSTGPICLTLKSPEIQLTKLISCGLCEDLEILDRL